MKYKVRVFTYDSTEEYTVEAENKSKARYKAFKYAKASGQFAACMTFWQFLDLYKPDVIPIIEVDLWCSKCGQHTAHEKAANFIEEGWRHYGSAAYCPKCSGICTNINHDKYSMALYLLNKLEGRYSR